MSTELFVGGRAHFHGPDTVTEVCVRCGATLWLQEANGHSTWTVVECNGRLGNHLIEYDPQSVRLPLGSGVKP